MRAPFGGKAGDRHFSIPLVCGLGQHQQRLRVTRDGRAQEALAIRLPCCYHRAVAGVDGDIRRYRRAIVRRHPDQQLVLRLFEHDGMVGQRQQELVVSRTRLQIEQVEAGRHIAGYLHITDFAKAVVIAGVGVKQCLGRAAGKGAWRLPGRHQLGALVANGAIFRPCHPAEARRIPLDELGRGQRIKLERERVQGRGHDLVLEGARAVGGEDLRIGACAEIRQLGQMACIEGQSIGPAQHLAVFRVGDAGFEGHCVHGIGCKDSGGRGKDECIGEPPDCAGDGRADGEGRLGGGGVHRPVKGQAQRRSGMDLVSSDGPGGYRRQRVEQDWLWRRQETAARIRERSGKGQRVQAVGEQRRRGRENCPSAARS